MLSIALFPCSYTDGARIIGELSYNLQLRVYTDEMLFSDVLKQFGISLKKMKNIIWGNQPALRNNTLRKDKYINLLKCTLDWRKKLTPNRYIYYGLHTSLFDSHTDGTFKVLVIDNERNRVRRAMVKDGLSEAAAIQQIIHQDTKVSRWTQFLFNKNAYDPTLHDLVIQHHKNDLFEITDEIIKHYLDIHDYENSSFKPTLHLTDQESAVE